MFVISPTLTILTKFCHEFDTLLVVVFFKVYKLSIGAACGLSWPSDCLIVQVLDDSTNKVLRVSL